MGEIGAHSTFPGLTQQTLWRDREPQCRFNFQEIAIWTAVPQCDIITLFSIYSSKHDCFPEGQRSLYKGKIIVIKAGKDKLKKAKQDHLKRKLQFVKKKILRLYCTILLKTVMGA